MRNWPISHHIMWVLPCHQQCCERSRRFLVDNIKPPTSCPAVLHLTTNVSSLVFSRYHLRFYQRHHVCDCCRLKALDQCHSWGPFFDGTKNISILFYSRALQLASPPRMATLRCHESISSHYKTMGDSLTRHLRQAFFMASLDNLIDCWMVHPDGSVKPDEFDRFRCNGSISEHIACRSLWGVFGDLANPRVYHKCSHLPIDKDRFHFSDSWNDNAAQNLCKYITEQ